MEPGYICQIYRRIATLKRVLFSQISEKPVIAARSVLEVLYQTFQVGVQAKFTLCPRTSGGEMSD